MATGRRLNGLFSSIGKQQDDNVPVVDLRSPLSGLSPTPEQINEKSAVYNVPVADLRTPVSGLNPPYEHINEQIAVYKATIAPLKTSLDMLQESVARMQIEPSIETHQAIHKIRSEMTAYKATHEDIKIIEAGLEAALKDQVSGLIRKMVDEGVAKHIDETVKQVVIKRLKACGFNNRSMLRVRDSADELYKLQIDLHNSESKRLNAQLVKGEDDHEPVHTLLKPDGTVAAHFPKTFKELYSLTPPAAKALLSEYGVQEPNGNDYRMVNRFMFYIGASYQLVRR